MSEVKQLTEPQLLSDAAANIADKLQPFTPRQREKIISMAKIMIQSEKPARAPRSDKGQKRKKDAPQHSSNCAVNKGLLCDCEER